MKTSRKLLLFLSFALAFQSCNRGPGGDTLAENPNEASLFQNSNVNGRKLGILGSRTLALTIDDGPTPGVTDLILDYLKKENVHVGFFLVGKRIAGNEKLLRRMRDEGHTVGNHTWDHPRLAPMAETNMDSVYQQIVAVDSKISPYISSRSHFYFRAPGGGFNIKGTSATSQAMNRYPILQKYIGPIYWDIGGQISFVNADGSASPGNRPTGYMGAAADWDCWQRNFPVESCANAYLRETEIRKGGIVLMHDHSDINEREDRTYRMLKILIPEWKKRGYRFITLDEVQGIDELVGRTVY